MTSHGLPLTFLALALSLGGLSCTSTIPTEVGTQFTPSIEDGLLETTTQAWLKRARQGEGGAPQTKSIQIAHGEATVEVVVRALQEPETGAVFVHSIEVGVIENEKWHISAHAQGTSVNLGTHEKPLQGVSVLVTATLETTWKTSSTQTLVSISADGTIAAN